MEEENYFSIYRKNISLIIKNNKAKNNQNEFLEINPLNFTLNVYNTKEDFGKKIIDCFGIIGIISLEENTYLITITKAELICTINKKEIYKVKDTSFIKFIEKEEGENLSDDSIDSNKSDKEEKNSKKNNIDEDIIKNLQDIFKTGFYFSNEYDLANSITSHNQIFLFYQKDKLVTDYDHIVNGNKNFLANFKLTDKVLSEEEKNKYNIKFFFSNVIYGNIVSFDLFKNSVNIILISRRFLWNYGMHDYRKGLSKYGGNSNQIETELILIINQTDVFSYIFLSGYIPIYFKQNEDTNKADKAFIKYFKTLIDEYNVLFLFSLQKDNGKYIDKFKNMLIKNQYALKEKWKYYNVDTKEQNIKDILDNIKKKKDLIEFVGFNHSINIKNDKNVTQLGIFFLLSTDGTSLYENEYYLIYDVIDHIFLYLNKSNENNLLSKEINTINEENNFVINEQNKEFIEKLKNAFIKKKEELSSQYYTNYTEGLNKKYQRVLEILFGKIPHHKTLADNLNKLKEEFSEISNLKIYVATWNVGGAELIQDKNLNLDSWLLPKDNKIIPDMYFVGFQEVVELKASNIIMANKEKMEQILNDWDLKINSSIQKIGKYKKFSEMNLIGINFYCYVLESQFDKISKISKKRIKTGMGGTTGNKGSCCINFDYENTSISVVCSHLSAGPKKSKNRQKELRYLLNLSLDSFFNLEESSTLMKEELDLLDKDIEDSDDEKNEITNTESGLINLDKNENKPILKNSDIWILFGDLNFRVDMDYEDFSEFIQTGNAWNKLLDYDQLTKFKLASLDLIKKIEEDVIKFQPTYKYIKNSNEFDYAPKNKENNKKKKNPSWCDRVIYKKNAYITKTGKKIITGVEYNSVMNENFIISDHRPVYQILDVIIFKEDKAKKDLIEKELIENEALGISNKYLKKKKFDF